MFLTLSEKWYAEYGKLLHLTVNGYCPCLLYTLVRTSWFSWIKLLVSRKCATQLITILWPVPDHWCYQWSGMVGPCSKQSPSLEAIPLPVLINNYFTPKLNVRSLEEWASGCHAGPLPLGKVTFWCCRWMESQVWIFWEPVIHYRCTPNVTHTLIWNVLTRQRCLISS